MSNVVGLRGQEILDGREPVSDVVKECEALLERALSGEITGVIAIQHWRDQATGYLISGQVSYAMVGRLEQAKSKALNSLDNP